MAVHGYSFTPGLQQRTTGNYPPGQSPLQPGIGQALQVLSYRLPGFLGGSVPAPDALLRGGGQVRPDQAVQRFNPVPSTRPSGPAPYDPSNNYAPASPSRMSGGVSGLPSAPQQFQSPASMSAPGSSQTSYYAPAAPSPVQQSPIDTGGVDVGGGTIGGGPTAPGVPGWQFQLGGGLRGGDSGGTNSALDQLMGAIFGGSNSGGRGDRGV
jgi:hypothetical protein